MSWQGQRTRLLRSDGHVSRSKLPTMGRESRRKILHTEIDQRLKPLLLELGFENTRTRAGKAAWPGMAEAGFGYARWRSGYVDGLDFFWDKYGEPWFVIFFTTAKEEDFGQVQKSQSGEVQAVEASGLLKLLNFPERWFGRVHSPARAIDLAIEGLNQLNEYLRSGAPGKHVRVQQIGLQRVGRPTSGVLEMTLTVFVFLAIFPFAMLWNVLRTAIVRPAAAVTRSRRR